MATVKGTWRFNDVLSLPSAYLDQNIEFTVVDNLFIDYADNRSEPIYVRADCTAISLYYSDVYDAYCVNFICPAVYETSFGSSEESLFDASGSYIVYTTNFNWIGLEVPAFPLRSPNTFGQTITFTSEQEVSEEFYAWFTANAVEHASEEQTPIATITYKGEILETLNGGEYVTLHTKDKVLEDDIRVEVADIPTPEDNYLPAEITTEAEMDALPIGAVFKYVGETTDKYENGTLYLVEESE